MGRGHLLVDGDDPLTVHKLCSTFPAFEFQARPVIPVEEAVRVELEAINWHDSLPAGLTILLSDKTPCLATAPTGPITSGRPSIAFSCWPGPAPPT